MSESILRVRPKYHQNQSLLRLTIRAAEMGFYEIPKKNLKSPNIRFFMF